MTKQKFYKKPLIRKQNQYPYFTVAYLDWNKYPQGSKGNKFISSDINICQKLEYYIRIKQRGGDKYIG